MMSENIPNLEKYKNLQIQEAQYILSRIKSTKTIFKLLETKDEDKNTESGQRKTTHYLQGKLSQSSGYNLNDY